MPKSRQDFIPEEIPWLVEDWFPLGHRGMDTSPEGSFKTILGCWLAVCIASGTPVFGNPVRQGPVLIVDEETPEVSLKNHLERFSAGLKYDFKELPITILSMDGFRFGRKVNMDWLLNYIDAVNPVFVRLDSLLAMLPSGRQAISENDCHLGETIRDDLNKLLAPHRSLLLSAHSKKYVPDLSFRELEGKQMQSIVRGHGSIVGEGCDTGYVLKKISEYPRPTRFCILIRVRRQAVPSSQPLFIEMKEEKYGEGWARLEKISARKLPPSLPAMKVYPLIKSNNTRLRSSQWILRNMAFRNKSFCRMGVEELIERRVLIESEPEKYELNLKMKSQCDPEYLKVLDPTI